MGVACERPPKPTLLHTVFAASNILTPINTSSTLFCSKSIQLNLHLARRNSLISSSHSPNCPPQTRPMSTTLTLSGLYFSTANPKLSFSSLPEMSLPRRQLKVSVRAFAETERRPLTASLYEVLRVNNNASQTEIKSAYRSLAKLYHPDASSATESDGQDFIEIHNAYATLSDPAARAMYDLSLSAHVHCDPRRRSVGFQPNGFYSTRRWETDQCW